MPKKITKYACDGCYKLHTVDEMIVEDGVHWKLSRFFCPDCGHEFIGKSYDGGIVVTATKSG